jgi:ABC-type sugar transport system permease subunit
VNPFSGNHVFIGWSHYHELFFSLGYWNSIRVTILFSLLTVPISIILSLFVALLLDEGPFGHGFFRSVFMLPVGISTAMAAMLWIFLFNPTAGYINFLIQSIGVEGPNWLGSPKWGLIAVSIATIWKQVGFNVIFFLAALVGVSSELKDAAKIDGANFYQRVRYLILPLISPTLLFVLVVSIIQSFESFGQIHILTKGGPANSTNVLVYNLYRDAFENFRSGFASAQAVVLFLIITLFTFFQFQLVKKKVHY